MVCDMCGKDTALSFLGCRSVDGIDIGKIPFCCSKCGGVNFPIRALNDYVYVWPSLPPESFEKSSIAIPVQYQQYYRQPIGVILSVGPGVYTKRIKYSVVNSRLKKEFSRKESFIRTEVKIGQIVVYDINTPVSTTILGNDSKYHVIPILGERDIKGIIV